MNLGLEGRIYQSGPTDEEKWSNQAQKYWKPNWHSDSATKSYHLQTRCHFPATTRREMAPKRSKSPPSDPHGMFSQMTVFLIETGVKAAQLQVICSIHLQLELLYMAIWTKNDVLHMLIVDMEAKIDANGCENWGSFIQKGFAHFCCRFQFSSQENRPGKVKPVSRSKYIYLKF